MVLDSHKLMGASGEAGDRFKFDMDSGSDSRIINGTSDDQLEKFDGPYYTQWAEKIKFSLMLLNVFYVIERDMTLIPVDDQADEKVIAHLHKQMIERKQDEALCCNFIKRTLSDRLCDLHKEITHPRLLWSVLEHEYKPWDYRGCRILVSRYMEFQITDEKSVLEQVHDLQIIVDKLKARSVFIPNVVQTGVIISKLPPTWRHFYLIQLYKHNDYSLDDLCTHIRKREEVKAKRASGKSPQNSKLGLNPKNFKRTTPQTFTRRHARDNKSRSSDANVIDAQIANMVSHVCLEDDTSNV